MKNTNFEAYICPIVLMFLIIQKAEWLQLGEAKMHGGPFQYRYKIAVIHGSY